MDVLGSPLFLWTRVIHLSLRYRVTDYEKSPENAPVEARFNTTGKIFILPRMRTILFRKWYSFKYFQLPTTPACNKLWRRQLTTMDLTKMEILAGKTRELSSGRKKQLLLRFFRNLMLLRSSRNYLFSGIEFIVCEILGYTYIFIEYCSDIIKYLINTIVIDNIHQIRQ